VSGRRVHEWERSEECEGEEECVRREEKIRTQPSAGSAIVFPFNENTDVNTWVSG